MTKPQKQIGATVLKALIIPTLASILTACGGSSGMASGGDTSSLTSTADMPPATVPSDMPSSEDTPPDTPPDAPPEDEPPPEDTANSPSITVSWQAPEENEDGSPVSGIDAYRIHYGETSGQYTQIDEVPGTATSHTIEVPVGQYYLAMTAVDIEGDESALSNEVSLLLNKAIRPTT